MTDDQNKNNFSDQIPVLDGAGHFAILGQAANQSDTDGLALADRKMADDLIDRLGLKFNDEVLERRFVNIVLAWRKGIRNSALTSQTLTKPIVAGGLGFEQNKARAVIAALEGQNTQPIQEIGLSTKNKPMVSPTAAALLQAGQRRQQSGQTPVKPHVFSLLELQHEIAPPPPTTIEPMPPKIVKQPAIRDVDYNFAASAKKPARPTNYNYRPTVVSRPTIKPRPTLTKPTPPTLRPLTSKTQKTVWQRLKDRYRSPAQVRQENKIILPPPPPPAKRITDIHVPNAPILIGPIEELKNFRLVDFRRLAGDPLRAVDKIKSKIDLLESESFTKKLAGIEAWRSSEVYRLYVLLGQQSLSTSQAITQIIAQRTAQNQPTLTMAEFNALAKLHSMLEY